MSIPVLKKLRGFAGLAGRDEPFIYRDPPKGVFTRKKETVNIADVMYMVDTTDQRGDPTRVNEMIQLYGRGQNPMVEVDYGGVGGGSRNTSIHQFQAGSVNKVEVVRPPLMPVETLVPLSAPRIHQNYSISTNVGSQYTSPNQIANLIDHNVVSNTTTTDTISGTIKSNPSQFLQFGPMYDDKLVNTSLGSKEYMSIASVPTQQIQYTPSLDNSLIQNNIKSKENMSIVSNSSQYLQFNPVIDVGLINAPINNNTQKGFVVSNPSQFLQFGPLLDNSLVKNTVVADKESGVLISNPSLQYIGEAEEALRPRNTDENKIKDTLLKNMNSNFSSIVIYDPKTNSSIDVYANLKDRNNIAITAAAGKPLVMNTNDGKSIKLKDYVYQVVQPNIGNTQLVIQVKQPDVILDRNMPLYAASTNLGTNVGYNDDQIRNAQDKVEASDRMTNFGSYFDRVSMPKYGDMRLPNNAVRKKKNLSAIKNAPM